MRARLLIIAAAILFSTAGAAIKSCGLSAWQVVCFRSALGALVLAVLLPGARERWRPGALAVGAVYALQMTLFVSATKRTTAANAIFLQSTAPLYLLVLGPWLLREPIRRGDLPLLAALALGLGTIALGVVPVSPTAPDPRLGNLLAAVAGLTWALTVAGMRWTARGPAGTGSALVAGNVLAFVACLPLALPVEAAPSDWLIVAFLGVVQVGLACVCLSHGLRAVPALEASLLMLLEPVLSPVWAWLVHGERPGAAVLAGGTIVLAATAVKTWADARHAEPA